jgi:hypothetical protein
MKTYDLSRYWPFFRETLGFLAASSAAILSWMRIRRAHSWPSTQGTIWQAEAREAEGSHALRAWVAEITYSYTVAGEYYTGYYRIGAFTERSAESRVAGWKGRTVVVRHHPSRPDVSVLLRSDQPGSQLGN